MRSGRRFMVVRSVTLLSLALLSGCGDDEPTTSPQDRLIGTWNCTEYRTWDPRSSTWVDLMDELESLVFTFDGDKLSASVTGDVTNSLCGSETECTTSTPYIATSSTITTNPDSNLSTTFDYNISGNVLHLDFGTIGPHLTLVRA